MATSWSTTREGLLQALLGAGADRQLEHLQEEEKILGPAARRGFSSTLSAPRVERCRRRGRGGDRVLLVVEH